MRIKLDHPILLAALAAIGLFVAPKFEPVPIRAPHNRGRSDQGHASDPSGVPLENPGLWPLTKRVLSQVSDNGLMTQAAAITFYSLLSLFPALAMLVSLFGLFADPATVSQQVNSLSGVMPGGGQQLLMDELKTLTSAGSAGLGWGFLIGLGTSLWTSNQAMKALFEALNQVHEVKEKRSFIKLTALTLLCTFGTVIFMIVALAAVVVLPAVLAFVGLGSIVDVLLIWLRWPLLLAAIAALLVVLFRFGPCRTKAVWRWISWGSGFAAFSWVIVSVLFSWYVSNFGNYNKTYGSLGAVVGFMTWIWISSTVILVGAQLDAELEKITVGKQRSRSSSDEAPAVLASS